MPMDVRAVRGGERVCPMLETLLVLQLSRAEVDRRE